MDGHVRGIVNPDPFFSKLDHHTTVRHPEHPGLILKRRIEDVYDTFTLHPDTPEDGYGGVEARLFDRPVGMTETDGSPRYKTQADTNMEIGGTLGTPNFAVWRYVRLDFDPGCLPDDLNRSKRNLAIELVQDSRINRLGTGDTLKPYLPRGGAKIIKDMIKDKKIEFWPWMEARFGPIFCRPLDAFHLRLYWYKKPQIRYPVTFKASLGPYRLAP